MEYQYLDSGNGTKLEQIGSYRLIRPCSQAVWKPRLSPEIWKQAQGTFTRDPKNQWLSNQMLPPSWTIKSDGIVFKIALTDFGHIGVFPEHVMVWQWVKNKVVAGKNYLNLFAYTGGATFALAQQGGTVCHVDASKTTVAWARENAELNQLTKAPIRWIVDDVLKFLTREVRRGNIYDGIILDPPTYGRGNKGEVFKIEKDLHEILSLCGQLLSKDPQFMILSSHTPGYTPLVLHHLLSQALPFLKGHVEFKEMLIPGVQGALDLPCGSIAAWFPSMNSVKI